MATLAYHEWALFPPGMPPLVVFGRRAGDIDDPPVVPPAYSARCP